MGRTWNMNEVTINEDGHKWIFNGAKQYDAGHVAVNFYCANPSCTTTRSLGVDPYSDGSIGLCITPKSEIEQMRRSIIKQERINKGE